MPPPFTSIPPAHSTSVQSQQGLWTPPLFYVLIGAYLTLSLGCFLWSTFPRYDLLQRFEHWMYRKVWTRMLGDTVKPEDGRGSDVSNELGYRRQMARDRRKGKGRSREMDMEIMCVGRGEGEVVGETYEMGTLPREWHDVDAQRASSSKEGVKKQQVKTSVVEMEEDEIWGLGRNERGEPKTVGESGWRRLR